MLELNARRRRVRRAARADAGAGGQRRPGRSTASRASWTSSASATAPTSRARIATFTLGYSHPIEVLLPDGVDLKIDKQTHLVLSGVDRQMVGQVAANIRALRPPDPYKNKGVRYTGEALRKKVGKTGAGAQMIQQIREERNSQPHPSAHPAQGARARAERPRLAVFRSLKHIYAQVIDDTEGRTLVSASSTEKSAGTGNGGNMPAPRPIGKLIAERAKEQGHQEGGLRPRRLSLPRARQGAGRAAREAGLEF